MTISGNYFNGSFGAVANTLTVKYRYKANSENYGGWQTATATISGNTYKATVNISGLDYRNSYTFEAMAADAIQNGDTEPFIYSAAKTVKTLPVIHWSDSDVVFTVPISVNGDIELTGDIIINGVSLKSKLGL